MGQLFLHREMDADQFRLRSDQAVKSGNPRWLWPEVDIRDWQSIAAEVGQITSDVLTHGCSTIRLQGDPTAVSVAALTTGMGPLLGHWLVEGRFPASDEAAEVLAHHLDHNGRRMENLATQTVQAAEGLAQRGIQPIVLKGMHTAFAYFPTPATRPMADIDIFIEPRAERTAASVLRELGFRHSQERSYPERTWRRPELPATPRSLYFVHGDEQWSIDLHLTVNLKGTSAAPPIGLDSLNMWRGAQWELAPTARSLEHPVLLIHLAAHAGLNLLSLTLLRLTELVLVIRKDLGSGLLSWDELRTTAERAGIMGALYPALSLTERLVPGTIPVAIVQACRNQAPPAVVRLIEALTPASAHGLVRCSINERFMWFPNRSSVVGQILCDLLPLKRPLPEVLATYRMLGWRLLRHTVSR